MNNSVVRMQSTNSHRSIWTQTVTPYFTIIGRWGGSVVKGFGLQSGRFESLFSQRGCYFTRWIMFTHRPKYCEWSWKIVFKFILCGIGLSNGLSFLWMLVKLYDDTDTIGTNASSSQRMWIYAIRQGQPVRSLPLCSTWHRYHVP